MNFNRLWQSACLICTLTFLLTAAARPSSADSARFDLTGPSVQVTVMRGTKTLPIASVPNLQAGDKLWVKPDFPEDQSAHYLLVVAFLRGATNPSPDDWFAHAETWNKQVRQNGITVAVPGGAQQALLFLAPATGGGFGTLRATVRSKPGVFVRAAEALNQASLDHTRLDKFLTAVGQTPYDTAKLHDRVALLTRSLAVKPDPECLEKPTDAQAACLAQASDNLILEDTHSQSVVASLTSGPSADLVGVLGASPMAKGGYYSPYIGSAMDVVRLLNGLRTASLQYLPALVVPKKEELNLRLNSPPSFQNPKSVLVVGLPAVTKPALPPLRPVDAQKEFCLRNSALVLPVEGAPLVFSTDMAHDFTLHLQAKNSAAINLPATADSAQGGFTIDTHSLQAGHVDMNSELTGTLRGFWGFDTYEGPSFHLATPGPSQWRIAKADALSAGQESTVHLESAASAACVEKITAVNPAGKNLEVKWRTIDSGKLEVQVALQKEPSETVKLMVQQFGVSRADEMALEAYSEAAHLESLHINAGDRHAVLSGTGLDEVKSVELNGVQFSPAKQSSAKEKNLDLLAPNATAPAAFTNGAKAVAHVMLQDGRTLDLQTTVQPPRPKVELVNKSVRLASTSSAIHLGNQDELPQDGQLAFLVKTDVPDSFPHSEQIEVATMDGGADTLLSLANGGLVLEDAQSVLATVDPLKRLGASAFGLLQFRPVDDSGAKGDWQPLARLVRTPSLAEIRCPDDPQQPCQLKGNALFLLDSIASKLDFSDTVSVPAGYAESTIKVPRPAGTLLYVKLRDDPTTVDTVTLPVFPDRY